MDYFDIPVALFLFKRKSTALQIIEKISQVRPLKIYILSDEGRTSVERKLVSNVRKSVEEAINWECEIIKNYANENRGVYAEEMGLGLQAAVVEKSMPGNNIRHEFIGDVKKELNDFYKILFDFNPTTVGGAIPDEGLYYEIR